MRRAAVGLLLAGAMTLTSCSPGSPGRSNDANVDGSADRDADQTPSAKLPVRPFQAEFVPKATGHGNFEICLSREAEENGIKRVTVPAAAIFQSWGPLTGDLRNSTNFDLNTIAGPKDPGTEYAVVLVDPVSLSIDRPCVITTAHAVTHDGFSFIHDVVPAELHLNFQADGLSETASGDISNDDPDNATLRDTYSDGFINGTPVADVAQVRRLHERDE